MDSAPSSVRDCFTISVGVALYLSPLSSVGWQPLPVSQDPLVRMPGSQQSSATLEGPGRCLNCHAGYDPEMEPGSHWKGAMMGQAARDPLFWACMTVAGQDSIWAVGRPNAMDLCLRCHFPHGWLEGRSEPPNASRMTGDDYDGLHCNFCHRLVDPFFEDTYLGVREGNDWLSYWDETHASSTPSQGRATTTRSADISVSQLIKFFDGLGFYRADHRPVSTQYTEHASGQYFVSNNEEKRGPFADDTARHATLYSRHHKSRYFCGACHDVSNPALANLSFNGTPPNSGGGPLPSEASSAFSYFHVERTFSEFLLSKFGRQGGAPGTGPFVGWETSMANNHIARCQDCHMPDRLGHGANKRDARLRPTDSTEHPNSGVPLHSMTGGNAWIARILASTVVGSPNYNATNAQLLRQGPTVLTLDLTQGVPLDPAALLESSDLAVAMLHRAATVENLTYDPFTGLCSFRVVNHTGHKLISGFPEGRRMFVSISLDCGPARVYEINPYDSEVGTLRGLPGGAAPLRFAEAYRDDLVFEVKPSSSLTGQQTTFHFVLATGRYKDNRIPPAGFKIHDAAARLVEPVWQGVSDTNLFTAAEYEGGYRAVELQLPVAADRVHVRLLYQTTSREYIAFLRDQINGTGTTLPSPGAGGDPAYLIQTDPYFSALKAWGNVIWQLWDQNKNEPGAAPILMAEAMVQQDTSDADHDGMPGYWESHYFGGPTNGLANADPDVDGLTHLEEYMAWTHPLVSDRFVKSMSLRPLVWPQVEGRVSFIAQYARKYTFQFASGLSPAQAWEDLGAAERGQDATETRVGLHDTSLVGAYRVRIGMLDP